MLQSSEYWQRVNAGRREARHNWYLANRERLRAKHQGEWLVKRDKWKREYYLKNREKILARAAQQRRELGMTQRKTCRIK